MSNATGFAITGGADNDSSVEVYRDNGDEDYPITLSVDDEDVNAEVVLSETEVRLLIRALESLMSKPDTTSSLYNAFHHGFG